MSDVVKECGVLQRKVKFLESQLKQLHNENSTTQQSPDIVSSTSRPLSFVPTNSNDVGLSTSWNAFEKNPYMTERVKVSYSIAIANNLFILCRNSDQHLCQ